MPSPTPSKRKYFSPRIERAKKALDKAAEHAAKKLITIIDKQAAEGKSELATGVLEHYEQDGQRLNSSSIDKQVSSGPTGPQILIGVGLGGSKPELPAIDTKVLDIVEVKKITEGA